MEFRKINAISVEYIPECFSDTFGKVELKFRLLSGSGEIFGVAWLNDEFEVKEIKKSKRLKSASLNPVLVDERFINIVFEQLELLSEFLQQEEAKEFYRQQLFVPMDSYEENILGHFDKLKEVIKSKYK